MCVAVGLGSQERLLPTRGITPVLKAELKSPHVNVGSFRGREWEGGEEEEPSFSRLSLCSSNLTTQEICGSMWRNKGRL